MNQSVPRNPIARFFIGLWGAMNFTRHLILNLVFFGFLFFLLLMMLIGMTHGLKGKQLDDRTTLLIAPQGTLVEQFSADPGSRALAKATGDKSGQEVQLRDLIRVIEAAAKDKKVERVLLDLDKLQPSGYASLREVVAALQNLKDSGKQLVAFSESMTQSQYLLAAQADEIYLDPMGSVLLEGLAHYRQYFRKGLQEKLGVDVHLFRVGEYKSAAEPFVLDAASADAKEADLFWMNDIWQRYLADIAKARKLDSAHLNTIVERLPQDIAANHGDLAKYALAQKLVDGLKTREQVNQLMIQRGVADKKADGGFRNVDFGTYLSLLDAQSVPLGTSSQIAVVVAAGEIKGGDQPAGYIGGESTSMLLRKARDEDAVKAVVLRVNSPGGEVFASEQIRREVVALRKVGKPVVVSMGDMAASGGYWISMDADRIYADPSTISGSIGIFGLVPNITRTLDKVGVHTDGVGTTRFAGALDITRALDPQVGQIFQNVIDKGYADFTTKVAQARHRSVKEIDSIARGRVWSGAQAKERGLVDELGGVREAITDAAKRAKLGEGHYSVRYVDKAVSPFMQFIINMMSTRIGNRALGDSGLARVLLTRISPETEVQLRFVEDAVREAKTGMLPVKPLVYCFCGL
ncbi:signal peptide peptidase SppA [Xylella fastidiosa]|uniref:signal peptide peptidase SppA n=1 Tax=Xylella fastidiosa TaxID=2371 RepID=UPI001190160D|nr:signal peptide peptidase SppA [Xylella fastidiosa]MBS9445141.1 signal peptide peptidase SppA [Xylella fastidiosa subsp. multiplex]MBS9447046.1 signal peptide peptidase SppA [Xylella fastidiosa subsp. multiplex]MBS9449047.1 signal peptide peptidase SppA [Xylella fastidiosa subsp. multiplex]MBS9451159.1 signal peptide peptidase SppA [Xylella fastidiosa subsp. multiplex]MBS9485266.1 signal peptide peptidase SppA [Xylella fastidiosa subsp. multiplex]